MFTKQEKNALDYFGGIQEFLSLCISYKEYYDNRLNSNPNDIDYECTDINGLCVINQMCICEDRNCLDIIENGNRYCVELSDESYEYLASIQMTLYELHDNLSDDYLDNFLFLEGKPFYICVDAGIVVSMGLVDPEIFFENLSILDKVMAA